MTSQDIIVIAYAATAVVVFPFSYMECRDSERPCSPRDSRALPDGAFAAALWPFFALIYAMVFAILIWCKWRERKRNTSTEGGTR